MKKEYIIPQMSIVQLQQQLLLNYSGPANAPEFDGDTNFDSDSELDELFGLSGLEGFL